ncbi:MAG: hypothetical protein ACUVQR_11230 [Thermogutta sp.]
MDEPRVNNGDFRHTEGNVQDIPWGISTLNAVGAIKTDTLA